MACSIQHAAVFSVVRLSTRSHPNTPLVSLINDDIGPALVGEIPPLPGGGEPELAMAIHASLEGEPGAAHGGWSGPEQVSISG